MMTQQLEQQSLYLANLWGKQRRPSPLPITHLKGMFYFEHINFKSKLDNGHGNEPTQWNIHSRFYLGINFEFL